MATIMGPHWIPQHYADNDRAVLAGWRPRAVKVVWTGVPAHLDAVLDAGPELIVIRDHPLSEQKLGDPKLLGVAHAKAIRELSEKIRAQYPGVDVNRLAFEGINEPPLWAECPPAWVADYETARLATMHADGLRAVVGNVNVGWPGDYGQPDSAVNWEPFAPIFRAMDQRDFLGLHEYWSTSGPEVNRLWWALRYLQCPAEVPVLITECGLDHAVVNGQHQGWHGLPGDEEARAAEYVRQLLWYEGQLRLDGRVFAAFVFTHDSQSAHWATFDTRHDVFLRHWLPEVQKDRPLDVWGGDRKIARWQWLLVTYGQLYQTDPRVLAAVMKLESGGKVAAISSAGAVGLMQVMPADKIAGRPPRQLLLNPDVNVRWGAQILASGVRAFGGSLAHGLASYYMGIGGVQQKGMAHPDAQEYLRAFAIAWRALWDMPLPGDVAQYLGQQPGPAPEPEPVSLSEIRWHAEEAVREIEALQGELAAVRRRLLDNVVAPLYQHEGQ